MRLLLCIPYFAPAYAFGGSVTVAETIVEGFVAAVRHEDAFRQELILAVVLLPAALWLGRDGMERALLAGTLGAARILGIADRKGSLEPGKDGDLVVFDPSELHYEPEQLVADLPGNASRLIQRADGYLATIKGGQTTFVEGEDTGARPGALLRGAR